MVVLYILPHQLYDLVDDAFIEEHKISRVVLWEHPDFFTKYKFNKKKLVLHRASMKYYYDKKLKKLGGNVRKKYVEHDKKIKLSKRCVFFDPINRMEEFTSSTKHHVMLESPNFLLTKDDYKVIARNKDGTDRKKIRFTSDFYSFCKEKVEYLEDTPNQDKFNRNKLNEKKVEIPTVNCKISKDEKKYIDKAIKYVNKHFAHHYGTLEDVVEDDKFLFPISSSGAKELFDTFVSERMHLFGKYQDAIVKEHSFLFHSILSSSINIGLIQPNDIVDSLRKLKTKDVPIQSTEAFFRQLCWREFQRYCYIHFPDFSTANHLKLNKSLNEKWYDGTTGIDPVDDCIKKAFDTAYLHHIERLMIIGNYMLISEIKPSDGFVWFMEFAIDSYEWVMHQNVYDMVFFCSGGKTTYKPYFTSNSYVLKMSNYSSKDEWNDEWKENYIQFIKNKKDILKKLPRSFPSKYLK